MTEIININAREILDSRGNPTVEAQETLLSGIVGRTSVPEAKYNRLLRIKEEMGDAAVYRGRSVRHLILAKNNEIPAMDDEEMIRGT